LIATSLPVTTTDCAKAKQMAPNKLFCDSCATTMAGLLGLRADYVSSTCSVGGSCSRRLSVLPNSLTRKLAGLPAVKVVFHITVPPTSSSSSLMTSLNSVAPSAFQSSLTASLVGTIFNGSVTSVDAFSQPTTSVSFTAFECFQGQSCLFDRYEIGRHYKNHKTTASTECAKACYADQACEAFESLDGNNLPYHCAFWMHGACNIETAGSKAPGFVSGQPGLLFCDKNTGRMASNSHMFGLKSAMYSIVFVVSTNFCSCHG